MPLRDDQEWRHNAYHITRTDDQVLAQDVGIRGTCQLMRLQTIMFPWSFPIDPMHLFYSNVIPQLFSHFRGKFFKANTEAEPPPPAPGTSKSRTKKARVVLPKFNQTNDAYCISPKVFQHPRLIILLSRIIILTLLDRRGRPLDKTCLQVPHLSRPNSATNCAPLTPHATNTKPTSGPPGVIPFP